MYNLSKIAFKRETMTRSEELFKALMENEFDTFQGLLKVSTIEDKRAKDLDGRNLLMRAAAMGRAAFVSSLLLHNVCPINDVDKEGKTALILATCLNQKGSVTLLLQKNLDLNIKDNKGYNAVMYAAHQGHNEILTDLINSQANLEATATNGATPLILATREKKLESVKRLLLAQVNTAARDNTGANALEIAATEGYADIVKVLLRAGADKNDPKSSAVLAAAKKKYPLVALELDSKGSFEERLKKTGCGPVPRYLLDPLGKFINSARTFKSGGTYDVDSITQHLGTRQMNPTPCLDVWGKMIDRAELELCKPNVLINRIIEDFVVEQEEKAASKGEAEAAAPTLASKWETREDMLMCPILLVPFGEGDAAPVTLSSGYTICRAALRKIFEVPIPRCPSSSIVLDADEINNGDNKFIQKIAREWAKQKSAEEKAGKCALKRSASLADSLYTMFNWREAPAAKVANLEQAVTGVVDAAGGPVVAMEGTVESTAGGSVEASSEEETSRCTIS